MTFALLKSFIGINTEASFERRFRGFTPHGSLTGFFFGFFLGLASQFQGMSWGSLPQALPPDPPPPLPAFRGARTQPWPPRPVPSPRRSPLAPGSARTRPRRGQGRARGGGGGGGAKGWRPSRCQVRHRPPRAPVT